MVKALYKYIVKKYQHKMAEKGLQYWIHELLKCCQSVCKAKWHYQKFVMLVVRAKHRFMNVGILHTNLGVPWTKVQFREYCSVVEFVEQFLNQRDQKLVFYRCLIQFSRVDLQAPDAVFLFYEHYWGREGTVVGLDDLVMEHFREHLLDLYFLHRRVSVCTHDNWICPLFEIDAMVEVALER